MSTQRQADEVLSECVLLNEQSHGKDLVASDLWEWRLLPWSVCGC